MKSVEGVVTIVQESRFQLVDDGGVGHLFVLGHDSLAEPEQIEQLARRQARVRVGYTVGRDVIGGVAHRVATV